METMKASRRKQTKPNRVPFGMDPDSSAYNAGGPGSLPPPPPASSSSSSSFQGGQQQQQQEEEAPRHNGGLDREMEEGDAPLDMHVSIISCKMCPETFPTSSDHRDHMDVVHGSALVKRSRMESEFPTAYHRLGSELFQENSLLPNGHGESQSQALSLTKPKPQPDPRDFEEFSRSQANGGEGTSHKVDGGKIFHQDAYCELCDREFCNKYFLKTHRANKHGIYDSSSPTTPLPHDGSNSHYEVNLPAPQSHKVSISPSPLQQQQLRKERADGQQQQNQSQQKKLEAELDTQKKVSSVITAVMNSMSGSQSDTKTPSSSSANNSNSSASTKDPSMEDYCEFCQKHFCNKYYLKKHKQDVHGIIPETGPTPTKRSRASSSLLDLPMSTSMGSPMFVPQPMASLGGMPSLPPGVMVLNPLMPQMTIIPTGNMPQPLLHASQLHHHPQSPIMSQHLPMPGSLPGISPNTPTSQASQLSPNPDTFCSQCRKEFSNAYFLKIHKANRHGIKSDDIPPEAKMLGDMVESNGIFIPPPPPSPDIKQEGGSHSRFTPPPLTSINQMVTCRQCDKDFPNAHAFKIHQITEHGKNMEASLPDSYESSLPKSDMPPISSAESLRRMSAEAAVSQANRESGESGRSGGGTTMFSNIVAAKLADRVICEICNKDLCNKYFLKSHKLKMHGIDTDKEEGRSPGDNSQQRSPTNLPPSSSRPMASPLNMSMGSPKAPPPPPQGLIMPKLEMRDFQEYSRDYKMMEKFNSMKKFADVPSFLSETINNEYMMRAGQSPFGMAGLTQTSSNPNLSHDQLVEEGIDPEAYCDICKKEFCSKYFLRTHKQNIHGIKVDVPPIDRSRAKPGPKPGLNKMSGMGGSNGNPLMGLPMPGMPFAFPPGLILGGSNGGMGVGGMGGGGMGVGGMGGGGMGGGGRDGGLGGGGMSRGSRDSYEKHQFRWKDPSNSQRVTCDICNKEVCNKYFLRTHKLKKHGIAPSETSLSPMSGSPVPSENDASSNHSSQPDNFLLDKGMYPRLDGKCVPQSIPLPPSERSAKSASGESQSKISSSSSNRTEEEKSYLMHKRHNHFNNNNNTKDPQAVNCHLCDREFRNVQWLSAHLMKDHAEACSPELMDLRMLPPPLGHAPHFGAELEPKVCQVCRILLPNEISLQLHLLQEHNAQIRLQVDDSHRRHKDLITTSSGSPRTVGRKPVKSWRSAGSRHGLAALKRQQRMFVCSACDYHTHFLSRLHNHEESVHGIAVSAEKKQKALDVPADKASPSLKQFKCGLCPSRFTTHAYCQMHVRESHIHMLKDFVSRKRDHSMKGKLSCTLCSFSTSFPFRLHSHYTRFHHHHRRPHHLNRPNGQRKSVVVTTVNTTTTTPVAEEVVTPITRTEVVEESRNTAPCNSSMETPSFESPVEASADAEDLVKQTFQMSGEEEEEDMEATASLTLADNFMSSMRPRVHEPVSGSFRMTEVTP
ncbi:hypothetical protein V1264_023901 [Littorina saxatilis]|uniref:C2H2-type domain-containing protein n=2 Tax=Littorina saxatilis TaxID=31220 RepID=A0AAN9B814_9CAEN